MAITGGSIGTMDQEIIVQTPVKVYNAVTNEQTKTWGTFATIWGQKLIPPAAREKFEGDQAVDLTTYRFRIRYLEGLTAQMRFVVGTEINYITGIDANDRNRFLIVTTEYRDNDVDQGTVDVIGTDITFQDEGITL